MKRGVSAAMLTVWAVCAGTAWAAADAAPAPAETEEGWADFALQEGSKIDFGGALAAITDKASRDLLGLPVDREAMRRTIRDLAWKVRGGIIEGGPREAAEAFRHALFVAEGLRPDHDYGARAEAETAVLSSVLAHKRGVCLSLSLLYLAAADEAGLPVYGVSVPAHFFVRYVSGKDRINLETLEFGAADRTDDFYRQKFLVREGESFYLEDLTPKMSLASYLSQLGAIYTRRGLYPQAIELLEAAQKASPRDPEIRTNLGVALYAAGRADDALAAWRAAVVLSPYDDAAHHHLAVELTNRGQWLEAIFHYDESLRLGHELDGSLMQKLEPHRPDALYTRK